MPIYPQISQYPIRRTRHTRTITNTLEDGSRIALADSLAATIRWNLSYSGLSDSELSVIQTFFESAEGRLNTFSFADPTANLLLWSEDYSQTVWQRNSLLQLAAGIGDPLGSSRATRITNTGSGDLNLVQTLPLPGTWTCCWSIYLRSDVSQTVHLLRDSNETAVTSGPDWQRFHYNSAGSASGTTSDFGVTFPAGSSINVFGAQVEVQAAASTYIPTNSSSGIYPNTRFDSDTLRVRLDAPNSNSCDVTLFSNAG
jgi:hypothetical protein